MKFLTTATFLIALSSPALADRCNFAPKPMEGIRGFNLNTMLLSAASYYELDRCFIINRRQFGSFLKFGFVNNFPEGVAPVGMIFIKSKKTFRNQSPPDEIKVSRLPGWYLQIPPAKAISSLKPSYDQPFTGTVQEWNALHRDGMTPEDLIKNRGFKQPWHAYGDEDRTYSSLDKLAFWTIDPATLPDRFSFTNYLLRFSPSTSYSFIPFTITVQDNVTEINVSVSSNIDVLVQEYRIIIE